MSKRPSSALLSRRTFLKSVAALPILMAPVSGPNARTGTAPAGNRSFVVVGAGAFGGWTALYLRRLGAEVTLLDGWGPGNSRASSGGETRVIRGMYGSDRPYYRLVTRAFELWQQWSARWKQQLYSETGALWMHSGDDSYVRQSIPLLEEFGLTARPLSLAAASEAYPQIDFAGVKTVYFEPRAGYLLARSACQAVVQEFLREGGTYRQLAATPGARKAGVMHHIVLSDGRRLQADAFVFACGPWLGRLFPEVLGERIKSTRQEVFFFGTPAGDRSYELPSLPIWVDFGAHVFYGIPGVGRRGFKIADDTRGAEFDPSDGDRSISAAALAAAHDFIRRRFPGIAGAPLIESRVCQYENSPDGHYIIDRHPEADNVWIVGGGSGHGFKMGPALGEYVAGLVDSGEDADQLFSLERFRQSQQRQTQFES